MLFASFGFIAVVAAGTNTPIALSVMGMELLPGNVGVYAALCACTAYLLVGHRSVYASQRLAALKSAALELVEMNGPVGKVRRGRFKVKSGTIVERIQRFPIRRIRNRKA